VSFDIAPGEILALIGESGSGKTTIALSLMGYARSGCTIQGGTIRIGNHDVTGMTERRRAGLRGTEVSYVPQSAAAAFNGGASCVMIGFIEWSRTMAPRLRDAFGGKDRLLSSFTADWATATRTPARRSVPGPTHPVRGDALPSPGR
jgi:ABC-type oligopeptide transport system ATPase subunit